MDELQKKWAQELSAWGLSPNEKTFDQFETYYRLLVEWNERMNLTAITERSEVYWKHFFDSVSLLSSPLFVRGGTLLDVGAGAGFPSVPVRIFCEDIQLTILDSLQKRITFLDTLGQQLHLNHFRAVHGRAEDIAHQQHWRGSFQQVTARAVARLPVLLELCLPFLEVGGMFFAMKGPEASDEVKEARAALKILGGEIVDLSEFTLPEVGGSRSIVAVRKISATSKKYPRKAGTPSKQPLL